MNTSTCAGPPWSLAFVIIVTSAPSVAFAMLHLSFVHGMTGESLGTLAVQLQRLPLQVDVDALSLELGQSLHGFVVQAQPLQDLLDNSEDDEEDDAEEGTLEWRRLSGLRLGRSHHRKSLSETSVTLHLLRPARIYLRNMRNSRASVWAGWRRWYAEFKEAAAEMPLLSIDVPQYRICNGFHFFGAANVRTLAAIILQDSDIDVTILTEEFALAGMVPFEESRDFQRRLLRKVRGLLVQVPGVEILDFVSEAKRPLLRMILPCGKKADVSAENREGCQKSAFIARHLHIGHPMLARSCLCLKTWAQRRGAYGQQDGFPSGLGFSCMAIFAAQCFEPAVAGQVGEVPELIQMSHVNDLRQRDATIDEDLPRIVRGVFQFYADVFDWDAEQVSPRRGHRQARRARTADGVLSIEDPVLPDLDLARPYMNLERSRQLHQHFTATAELLAKGQWNAECLHDLGIPAGVRILDLYVLRDNRNRRETRLLPMLTFIAGPMWKNLFGHSAELFKAETDDNSYYVNDKTLLVNRFISVPRDLGDVNCGAFVAGMVE
ncbi:unnamed protein product, partial [Symbiodinium sp. KB8]